MTYDKNGEHVPVENPGLSFFRDQPAVPWDQMPVPSSAGDYMPAVPWSQIPVPDGYANITPPPALLRARQQRSAAIDAQIAALTRSASVRTDNQPVNLRDRTVQYDVGGRLVTRHLPEPSPTPAFFKQPPSVIGNDAMNWQAMPKVPYTNPETEAAIAAAESKRGATPAGAPLPAWRARAATYARANGGRGLLSNEPIGSPEEFAHRRDQFAAAIATANNQLAGPDGLTPRARIESAWNNLALKWGGMYGPKTEVLGAGQPASVLNRRQLDTPENYGAGPYQPPPPDAQTSSNGPRAGGLLPAIYRATAPVVGAGIGSIGANITEARRFFYKSPGERDPGQQLADELQPTWNKVLAPRSAELKGPPQGLNQWLEQRGYGPNAYEAATR